MLPPAKGISPVIISYSRTPQLHTSVRASTGAPRACSGDMYGVVPTMRPATVSRFAAAAAPGATRSAELLGELGDAEVEHLDVAVAAQHHVLGLDVAMHDALVVRGDERRADLDRDVHGLRRARAGRATAPSRSVSPSISSLAM